MHKTFNSHCPTKDKAVTLTVNYIDARTLEDKNPVYSKERIKSCSHMTDCSKCTLYDSLPQSINA